MMGCESDCPNLHRLQSLEEDYHAFKEKNSADHKEFYNRIEMLEKESALHKNDLEHIKETVDEVNTNVKSLMAMPGKRYETLIVSVITALAGTFVGFLLSGNIPV